MGLDIGDLDEDSPARYAHVRICVSGSGSVAWNEGTDAELENLHRNRNGAGGWVSGEGANVATRGSGATQQRGSGDQLAARTTNDALGVGPLRGDWKSLLRTALHNAKAFHSGREQQL